MDKIRLENVSYVYGAGTPFEKKALDDVTVGIRTGCITGVIGHTGSGKSTMMQLLNGLAKPSSGRVLLDGYDINATVADVYEQWRTEDPYSTLSKGKAKKAMKKEVIHRRRRLCFRVGLAMQYPEYQLFEETVFKDIAFGPKNMDLSEDEIFERVMEAAAFAGVEESWMNKSPFDLSGGQKRRVALAGVIAMRPEVLVLDEPGAGLDPRGRNSIFQGIVEYQRATGSTVVIVSHSMEDMARLCDDLIVMSEARVVRHGNKDAVFANVGQLSQVGLDIPQISRLMQMLREKGVPVSEDIYTVDAALDALKTVFSGEVTA